MSIATPGTGNRSSTTTFERPRARSHVLRGSRLVAAALALSTAAISSRASATDDPARDWWTVETPHFRVHYARSLEPVADRVATLAETIHARLVGPMGHAPSSPTEIVLTDDTDDANGSATALPFNTVRLYITAPDDTSPLGDYDDWYTELVTHEYTHILHTDDISGVPRLVNAILGKTMAPNQVQPRWILEGLAVVSESRHSSAGRLRSNLFDMFLRADVLDGNVAGLDQISNQALRWPQGNLWYLYGSRFLGWISQVYGPDTMRAVAVDYSSMVAPWQMNRAIRRVTGRTYEELFQGFLDHIRRLYAAQMREVEARGRREGVRLTHHGASVLYPRFVPDVARSVPGREELVYMREDLDARAGIYRVPLGELRDGGDRPEELVARTNGRSVATFTPSGDLVFNSVTPWKNVYSRNDLYLVPRGERSPGGDESVRKRLTWGLRAEAADVSPDGRRIVFTVNNHGTTFLEIADIDAAGAIVNRRDLVPSARFEQAYTPRFSPDGTKVAYSAWTAGGYRDVRIVDVATGHFDEVAHDRALDLEPVWSPDGQILYFSSDRSGIFNIYALELAKKTLKQVTNVRTGALEPAVSGDGATLVYVGYTSAGWDLYGMPLDPSRWLDAPPAPRDRPDPPAEPLPVTLRHHRYSPLPTLAPRSFSFTYKPGSYGANALTLSARGTDVVGHHSIGANVVLDPNAPEPQFSLDYTYGRLPFDMTLRAFHALAPRSGYRYSGQNVQYDEVSNGLSAAVSLPIAGPFSNQAIALSFSAVSFKGKLPVASIAPDPYATRTILPQQGYVGIVHLGYAYSNVESSLLTAGPVRGVRLNLGFDYAGQATGSDYSVRAFEAALSGYVPMPWPGHHTLAMRTSGAIAGGDYARDGVYFVGGYDLERASLLDEVTTGALDGAFVLRGYPARQFIGREYLLETLEYRFPILSPDHGLSTLPVYLRRISGSAFVDYGGAFNQLDLHRFQLFHDGGLIDQPQLHAAVGGELWFDTSFGYFLSTQLRLGYALGLSQQAIPGGQWYFVAAGAF